MSFLISKVNYLDFSLPQYKRVILTAKYWSKERRYRTTPFLEYILLQYFNSNFGVNFIPLLKLFLLLRE